MTMDVRRLSRLFAALVLAAPLCASGQIVFGTPPRSSSAVGINNVAAPVPQPLLQGKRAFISYEIGDVTSFPGTYSGGPERAYQEFYTQMQQWGRYQLVGDPKDADVIFAVRFVDPPGGTPQIRLGVMSTGGRVSLWGFVEPVNFAFRKRNRDADFSQTVKQLLTDLQTLLATAPGAPVAPPR
jgi:hypothetical protein